MLCSLLCDLYQCQCWQSDRCVSEPDPPVPGQSQHSLQSGIGGKSNGSRPLQPSRAPKAKDKQKTRSLPASHVTEQQQPRQFTVPLEAHTMPTQLTNALEHIVSQLDVLTQVSDKCLAERCSVKHMYCALIHTLLGVTIMLTQMCSVMCHQYCLLCF